MHLNAYLNVLHQWLLTKLPQTEWIALILPFQKCRISVHFSNHMTSMCVLFDPYCLLFCRYRHICWGRASPTRWRDGWGCQAPHNTQTSHATEVGSQVSNWARESHMSYVYCRGSVTSTCQRDHIGGIDFLVTWG